MSVQEREELVNSPHTLFQNESQREDLLDPSKTDSGLVALLHHLCVQNGWNVEFTAIRSDHHDDSGLNPTPPHEGTHAAGFAADLWPLASDTSGDYLDADDPKFAQFLENVRDAPYVRQIGLAGSAQTDANRTAAGDKVFDDDGADHVHIGADAA